MLHDQAGQSRIFFTPIFYPKILVDSGIPEPVLAGLLTRLIWPPSHQN